MQNNFLDNNSNFDNKKYIEIETKMLFIKTLITTLKSNRNKITVKILSNVSQM